MTLQLISSVLFSIFKGYVKSDLIGTSPLTIEGVDYVLL